MSLAVNILLMVMRRHIGLGLVLVSLAVLSLIASPVWALENYWAIKEQIPTITDHLKVVALDGKIHAIGGKDATGVFNQAYDPENDSWVKKASMPTHRLAFAIAAYQNKIYCIGGSVGERLGTNEVYDPATDTWTTKASMPTPRSSLSANVVNGKIYLIGGFLNIKGDLSNLTEVYDPATDAWETKASIPTLAHSYVSAVIDEKIHIISYSTHLIYDPKADNWSYGVSPPYAVPNTGVGGATTGVMAPARIYTIGVVQDQTITQVYDSRTDSWSVGASMPTARYGASMAVVNDKLYVIGGVRFVLEIPQHYYPVNEEYTPFGYGTPNSTDPLPTFSPSHLSTPTPALTLTPSPSTTTPTTPQHSESSISSIKPSPSISPSSPTQQPTVIPTQKMTSDPFANQPDKNTPTVIAAIVVITIITLAGMIVYFKKANK